MSNTAQTQSVPNRATALRIGTSKATVICRDSFGNQFPVMNKTGLPFVKGKDIQYRTVGKTRYMI